MGAQPSNRPSRTRPSFRLAAALLLLVVTAASLRPAPSAKAAPADGLWVATADGLSKRSPVDGGLLLSVAGTPDARFLAVDEQRGRVWLMNVAANKAWRLRAFAMDGAFILEVNLNLPKRPPLGMVDIALEGDSGVVAVAYARSVYRYGPDGAPLGIVAVPSRVYELEYDSVRSVLWARAVNAALPITAGVLGVPIGFPSGFAADDLDVDPLDGELWAVSQRGRLARLAPGGAVQAAADVSKSSVLGADATGVWVAGAQKGTLSHFDSAATPTETLRQFASLLLPDLRDGSLFSAAAKKVTHRGTNPFSVMVEKSVQDMALLRPAPVPPTANAGADAAVRLPALTNLDGTVTPPAATVQWTKRTGPGTVTFGNSAAIDTNASFGAAGLYVLRLTASHDHISQFDEVTIAVAAAIPPVVDAGADDTVALPGTATLDGTVSPAAATHLWTMTSGPGTVTFGNSGAIDTSAEFSDAGEYVLRLTATHDGITLVDEVTITVTATATGGLVAPALTDTAATDLGAATAFLYTGPDAVQTGVTPGILDQRRPAVIRGTAFAITGEPMAGVTVEVLGHPEFGQTLTRADGMFDLAVNGGGYLTIVFSRAGYLPAQRTMFAPVQRYTFTSDVILIQADPNGTVVDLSAAGIKVARGSVSSDLHGTRRGTLLFPDAVTAVLQPPTGPATPASLLTVRVTEFTVGETGPRSMPAELPANSAYTYAVELSVDQADPGAGYSVQFSGPVAYYVENFLGFPVGGAAPLGFYDRARGLWVPLESGIVLAIVSETGGMADLDLDGDADSDAADATVAATLGISDAERTELATLYAPGQELWRVQISHFSFIDINWSQFPLADVVTQAIHVVTTTLNSENCTLCPGSSIELENQSLGEVIGLTGVPFGLHYDSLRMPGASNAVEITLTEATVPPELRAIDLIVNIAGQHHTFSYPLPAPNLKVSFIWDGKDGYGRKVVGTEDVYVQICNDLITTYDVTGKFGIPSGGGGGPATVESGHVCKSFHERLSAGFDIGGPSLGGWSPSVHHVYDPYGRTLYYGTGERQSETGELGSVIETAAGGGNLLPQFANNTPADQISFGGSQWAIEGVTSDPKGGFYVAAQDRLLYVDPDGFATVVAGGGNTSGFSGPGLTVNLGHLYEIALGFDGKVYLGSTHRVLVYDPETGNVSHVAGTGSCAYSPFIDNIVATSAEICDAPLIAPMPDGSLYVATWLDNFQPIKRITTDGIIHRATASAVEHNPNGTNCVIYTGGLCAYNVPALQSAFANLDWIASAPDGSLFIASGGSNASAIARLRPDGFVEYFSGLGDQFFDGIPVGLGASGHNTTPSIAPDGSVFFAYRGNSVGQGGGYLRIRKAGADGIMQNIIGNGSQAACCGGANEGESALAVPLHSPPRGFAFGLEDEVLFKEGDVVRRVRSRFRSYGDLSEIFIASRDGSEIYRFDGNGRHLTTLHALTGAVLWSFGYDTDLRLVTLTDAFGNVTTIERDLGGAATAIEGPFGDRTTLAVDGNGYLEDVTNPASENVHLAYTSRGLLTELSTPKGDSYTFSYTGLGFLASDSDPAGGSQTLNRFELEETDARYFGRTSVRSTAMGRTTSSDLEYLKDGRRSNTITSPDGHQTTTVADDSANTTQESPEGVVFALHEIGDPRFSLQSPIAGTVTIANPGGLTATTSAARTVVLTDPSDIFSIVTLTGTSTVNGRVVTTVYDGPTQTAVTTSPEGRTSTVTIDAFGRPTTSLVPGLAGASSTYDARGRLESATVGAGVDARTTTMTYNARGFLETVTDPMGRVVRFEYDAAGRVSKQIMPGAREITFTYDVNGNLITFTPPGKPAHTFAYSPIDQVTEYTAPDVGLPSENTIYTYNLDHQLDLEVRPDGLVTDLEYHSAGRLSTITFSRGTITWTYNPATGLLQSVSGPSEGAGSPLETVTYTYEGALQTAETWAGPVAGSVGWTYDNNFRVIGQTVNGANSITYAYDDDDHLTGAGALSLTPSSLNGLLTAVTLDTITDTWSYNDFAEVARYDSADASTTFYDATYTRDQLGRITQKVETILGAATAYGYFYEAAGRLSQVDTNFATTAEYTYDLNGNRLTGPGVEAATHDAQDRLLTYGGNEYTYDAAGDLETKVNGADTTTYTYDELGNLTKVLLPNGDEVTYVIDPVGRRIGRKVNGALEQGWLYDGGLAIVAELDAGGALISRFVYATGVNMPDYVVQGGRTYRIVTDHLGSLRLVVDAADGTVVQRMNHDEYGRVTEDLGAGGFTRVSIGFAGGLYDPLTGLVRFGARDYDPESGRWTTKDPILSGWNAYEYADSDPVNRLDVDGLAPYSEGQLAAAQRLEMEARELARGRATLPAQPAKPGPRPRTSSVPKRGGWVQSIGKGPGQWPAMRGPGTITVGATCPPAAGTASRLARLAPIAKRVMGGLAVAFFAKDWYQNGLVLTCVIGRALVWVQRDALRWPSRQTARPCDCRSR